MKPVWIVDDDRSIRWVFEKALGREGIAFSSFASAREALEALASSVPQVLVSDIRMPGASGIELLQAVKEKHPSVPVIVMTAYSDLESAVAAFQSGAEQQSRQEQIIEEFMRRRDREQIKSVVFVSVFTLGWCLDLLTAL